MTTAKYMGGSPRVLLDVNQEIIDRGTQADSSHCLIAEAVKAAVPDAQRVAVDLATIRWTDPKTSRRFIYLTPRIAQEALIRFDQGIKPEPFRVHVQGAMITVAGQRKPGSRSPKTEPTGKTKMVPVGSRRTPPVRVGGKTPPQGVLSNVTYGPEPTRKRKDPANRRGARREFGLRVTLPKADG